MQIKTYVLCNTMFMLFKIFYAILVCFVIRKDINFIETLSILFDSIAGLYIQTVL